MGAPLVATSPIFAICFLGNAIGKRLQQKTPDEVLGPGQLAAAGALSGVMSTIVMAPGERIKCLLQVQNASRSGGVKYSGPVDVIKSLYREGGVRSIFFASYELIQRWLQGPQRTELSVGSTLFAGGLAGMCNWLVAIPMDVVKSRLQAAPEGTYSGALDVLKKLLAAEGPRALWKGAVPVLMRAFPANAACFLGYETAMHTLNQLASNL